MRTSRFTASQIGAILKQNEAGVSVPDLCREHEKMGTLHYQGRDNKEGKTPDEFFLILYSII